jgi:predicted kinase
MNFMAALYLICGMAGSGKTSVAKQLETSFSAIRFSPDEWIEIVIKDETDKMELDRLRAPIEALQWGIAKKLLQHGISVILENGFWSKEERLAYLAKAKEFGAAVELHYLNVPKDELWRRLQKRNEVASGDSFRVTEHELETWLSWFAPPDSEEALLYDTFVEHKS